MTTTTTSSPPLTNSSTPKSPHTCSGEFSPKKLSSSNDPAHTLTAVQPPYTPASATNVGKSSPTTVPSTVPSRDSAAFVVAPITRPPLVKYPTSNVLRLAVLC